MFFNDFSDLLECLIRMWGKVFERMDQVKFVEDSVFKIYLIHTWILFLKYTLREHLDIIAYGS